MLSMSRAAKTMTSKTPLPRLLSLTTHLPFIIFKNLFSGEISTFRRLWKTIVTNLLDTFWQGQAFNILIECKILNEFELAENLTVFSFFWSLNYNSFMIVTLGGISVFFDVWICKVESLVTGKLKYWISLYDKYEQLINIILYYG